MKVNEAMALVSRIDNILTRGDLYGYKAADYVSELQMLATDLEVYADELDLEMSAFAQEQFLDKIAEAVE